MSFECSYTVTLNYPLSEVVKFLRSSDPARMEAVERLNPHVATFKAVKTDLILGKHVSVDPVSCKDLPAITTPEEKGESDSHVCTRVQFLVTQTFNFLGGLSYSEVPIEGTQTVDEENQVMLAETTATSGITVRVWKTRKFQEVDLGDGKKGTEVTEDIKGTCPWVMKGIIGPETRRALKANMDKYSTLFQKDSDSV